MSQEPTCALSADANDGSLVLRGSGLRLGNHYKVLFTCEGHAESEVVAATADAAGDLSAQHHAKWAGTYHGSLLDGKSEAMIATCSTVIG